MISRHFSYIIYSLLLVYICTEHSDASKLPKTWKVCHKSDPNVNECLREAIDAAIHELALNGNPSLAAPIMDPLRVNKLVIDQGTGPVSIKLDFLDLDVIGIKDLKVTKLKNDWKLLELEGKFLSQFALDGNYKINGKVMVLPITGEGHARITYDNFSVKAKFKLKEITKNGKQYYEATNVEFDFDSDKVHLKFDNLFNGDKALGDNMNLFLNENWREVFNEIKPAISAGFGAVFKQISNRILSQITVNEINPA